MSMAFWRLVLLEVALVGGLLEDTGLLYSGLEFLTW